jgi:hypothetical protein
MSVWPAGCRCTSVRPANVREDVPKRTASLCRSPSSAATENVQLSAAVRLERESQTMHRSCAPLAWPSRRTFRKTLTRGTHAGKTHHRGPRRDSAGLVPLNRVLASRSGPRVPRCPATSRIAEHHGFLHRVTAQRLNSSLAHPLVSIYTLFHSL